MPSALDRIADAKAVRCRAAATDVMGQGTKSLRDSGEVEAGPERYPDGRDRG